MKRVDLIRHIERNGCEFLREGDGTLSTSTGRYASLRQSRVTARSTTSSVEKSAMISRFPVPGEVRHNENKPEPDQPDVRRADPHAEDGHIVPPISTETAASPSNVSPSPIITDFAMSHELTVYDAAYVELAVRRQIPLASRHQSLKRAAYRLGVPLLL